MEPNKVSFYLVPATECARAPGSKPAGQYPSGKQYDNAEIVTESPEIFQYHKLVTSLVLDCLLYFLKIERLFE